MIVKSSAGAYMYATSDLACVLDRTERLKADRLLYVIGAPQSQHLEMVFKVSEMGGWLSPPTEAVHVSFGNVLGADRKILRSRSGDAVKLIELLDEAIDRATAAVATKNPELDEETRAEVARMVGMGAVKYADLSTDRVRDYVFDFDRMLAFDGDTAPYIQYAHARINSIFRRAGVDRADVRSAPISLDEPAEKALAMRILGYPAAIDTALETYSPHKLSAYVYDLATDFTTFYDRCPILKSDEPVRTSRLALADLTARTIAHALGPARHRGAGADVNPAARAVERHLLPDSAGVAADGSLTIGGCRVDDLAAEFGTPVFVYDEEHLRTRCREAVRAFGRERAIYATKAFLCKAMARLAHDEGLLLDVASGGELHVALAAGVPGSACVLHGNNKSTAELRRGDHRRCPPHRRRLLRRARPARRPRRGRCGSRPEGAGAGHPRRARPHPRVHRHGPGRLEVRVQPRQR